MLKYKESFLMYFNFYLKVYRTGLCTFSGAIVNVDFDVDEIDARFGFRLYENGDYKFFIPKNRHPNVLKAVIVGKKSFGLHIDMWAQGIAECTFSKYEVLSDFKKLGIEIPEKLMIDFENRIWHYRNKYSKANAG